MGPAGRGGPAHDARSRFLDIPPGSLLTTMVATAGGVQIAFAGRPFRVGDNVVEVAVDGLGTAARGGAAGSPGADQVLQLAARGIAVLGVPVLAGAFGDGPGDGVQSP